MNRREMAKMVAATALLQAARGASGEGTSGEVFELRVYHTFPGKLADLEARFRDHTITIFRRHGIESVAYWAPIEDPLKGNALLYMLRHPSREAAKKNWGTFHDDPEWQKVSAASEANGKLVEKVDSTFLQLTDFSPKV